MPGPRILGQTAALAVTEATLYTAPLASAAGLGVVVSTIALVSTGAAGTARVRAVPAAAGAATAQHTLIPVTSVAANELITVTAGITLAPGDKLVVTTTGGINVHAYGTEL